MIQNNLFRRSVDGKRSKKGVSPVIGVILMVAATIVIAAVVIAMLGGFSPPSQTYVVMATTEVRTGGTGYMVVVTYQGGPDADQVDTLSGTAMDSAGDHEDLAAYGNTTLWDDCIPGAVAKADTKAYTLGGADDHVIVTAKFLDGSKQIILDTWV